MSSTMREVLAGNENLEVTTFSEDEVRALTAITARLLALCGCRDMTMWIDDDDSGKRSSAWDIFLALAGRGTFPYQEEQTVRAVTNLR